MQKPTLHFFLPKPNRPMTGRQDEKQFNKENTCIKPQRFRRGETCEIIHNTCLKWYFNKDTPGKQTHMYRQYINPPTDRQACTAVVKSEAERYLVSWQRRLVLKKPKRRKEKGSIISQGWLIQRHWRKEKNNGERRGGGGSRVRAFSLGCVVYKQTWRKTKWWGMCKEGRGGKGGWKGVERKGTFVGGGAQEDRGLSLLSRS